MNESTPFAAWLGRLAAACAGILAAVWLWEASPQSTPAMDSDRIAAISCHYRITTDRLMYAIDRTRTAQDFADLRQRELACGPRPAEPRTTWDEALALRGLIAAAVAVALLLLAERARPG